MKFLIADDDGDTREFVRSTLESQGHVVAVASNGVEALEMATHSPPEMIVSDILMPEMDGFMLCREIIADENLHNIPFVFYSGTYMEPEHEKLGMALGASAFIRKPMEPDLFIQTIAGVISDHQKNKLTAPSGLIEDTIRLAHMHENALVRKLGEKVEALEKEITERKQADALVVKLSQAIEQAGEAILITDTDAIIEYVNPAFSKITGYDVDEVIGKTPAVLNSGKQDDAFYQRFWQKITSGETWHGSLVDQRKDGSLYPALMSVAPIFDADGIITHYVSIQQDMSEHEELEEKFRQAQKMETLGTLVGGIAHDFNNVLAGMLGNLYLVKKQTVLDSGVQEKLERVEKAGLRAADMIKQLLAFSRKAESEFSLMPVQPFIKEVLKLARASIPENIALQYDLGSQDYCIRGDGSQIQQMILNLLVNASHALVAQDKPVITVSMRVYAPDDDFLFVHREIENRPLLCITVGDNGCGISKANLEHVFEPFFTTKAEGKGTGLGLAMVYGSMQNHAGVIEIESEEGDGTRICLFFPLSEAGTVPDNSEKAGIINGKGETILLADDNEQVRQTMQEVLQDFGYRVLAAENGQQALLIYIDHASEIGLVLLDIIMPVMGGVETAERLRELKPDVPILFLSGYEKGVSPSDKAAIQDIAVLTKPVDLAELSHHIHASMRK